MSKVVQFPEQTPLYSRDYYAWACEQARALRERCFEALDFEHLSQEVEDLAKSERRQLQSRLMRVLAHLLKCQFQSGRRSPSWEGTLASQRTEIAALFHDSPSLERELPEIVEQAYSLALRVAGKEMRLKRDQWQSLYPVQCPWSAEQILDEDFYPEPQK
jgi:uncharacterized protein DUF29